jgi:ribosome biogenesis GTPase / thiamine phosphate phosphatase
MTSDLASLGWDAGFAAAYRPFARVDAAPARVLRADRGVCTVLGADGVTRASLAGTVLLAAAGDAAVLPCAGDWVVLRRWPDRRTTVEVVLPRRTVLVARTSDRGSAGQVLAANVDVVAVVEPMHPAPGAAPVGRLLALARDSGAEPVLVLSKSDAARRPAAVARRLADLAPGVRVLPVSVPRGHGLGALRGLVAPGRTVALLGRPGAGRSTLVDALVGTPVAPVRGIRQADPYPSLVPVPGGGAVLDTPGIPGLDDTAGLDRALAARPPG